MPFPKITLPVANEFFKSVGVQITEHPLGFYEAEVAGRVHSNAKLGVLVTELMMFYFNPPQRPSIPLVELTQDVEPDFEDWMRRSEKRHTDAGIL